MLSVLVGPGGALGDLLVADPRVRKVSFTGSTGIGERIAARAGVKKLSLELGASCPVVIMPDADLGALASSASAVSGVLRAGFRMTALPAASAGAILCNTSSEGKLNGVIATTIPTGCRTVKPRSCRNPCPCCASSGSVSP